MFQPEFREDLRYWVETDRKTALRVFQLIEAIMRDPFQGIGKPEPLKFLGSGVWSRRITQEHRLVYVVGHERVDFIQTRYHYFSQLLASAAAEKMAALLTEEYIEKRAKRASSKKFQKVLKKIPDVEPEEYDRM